MQRRRRHCICGVSVQLVWLLALVWSWRMVEAQQAPKTDPIEVAALNTILGRWGLKASSEWNISGEPCSGFASDGIDWDHRPNINPFIKCVCSYDNSTTCHITRLRVRQLNIIGPIPSELQNLTYLVDLDMNCNYLTGAIPPFIGKLTKMQFLGLGSNALSGPLPKELGNLANLLSLGLSMSNFTGELPEELGNLTNLQQMYVESCGLSGPLPSTFSKLKNLKILRVSGNEFTGKIPDFLGSLPNLVDVAFHGNSFEGPIPESLSNLTKLTTLRIGDIVNGSSSLAFISNLTSLSNLMLRNCRISGQIPQSILNLGNLQFLSLGNNSFTGRLPEVISSSLESMDFSYNQLTGSLPSWTTRNNLQLNLVANNFFVDSSTDSSALPSGLNCLQQDTPCFRGSPEYYSFAVNCGANSSTRGSDEFAFPNTLTWQSLGRRVFDIYVQGHLKEKNFNIRKTAVIFVIFSLVKKRRTTAQQKELYNLVGRPDVFSYAELKLATNNFSSQNILGEGGYGPVYKGKLPDGRDIAVKQLSQSSHQGKSQFVAEVWSLYEQDQALAIVDPSLKEFNKDEAFRVICVALLCTQSSPHLRPAMSKVVAMLTGEVEVAEVVTKPSYINEWLLRDGNRSYVTSSY
ncbi:hypothetical protein GUJ93_ZPchr0088g33647 [Zizania palustris]|uniref:non-specific serine/threonine protein kinase n=1 Tax=Zizania palustris TaxID=103762 RepID=A0A8J5VD74_ZIZPA|nr:hypothetical protein GUJ93_ZPchr0088g33647 [Zizania palustris]